MIFPVWEVPTLGNGWVIGLTATLHVFISHFAIGGGAFLAFTEHIAQKRNDDAIYDWLKTHAKFFLLITTVLGVVTGVGIWWSIGLANPSGTQVLLQNFSLFWAVEYIFFLLEILTFYAWYYTFGRVDRKTHLNIAWWYFGISFFTLFVINGIITFMLTNGGWPTTMNIWDGYFNPAFAPALFLRLFIMFALAGVYALLTASRIKGNDDMKAFLLQYSSKWMLPALVLGPLLFVWYIFTLPPDTQAVIANGLSTIGEGNFSIMARVIVLTVIVAASLLLMTLIGPYLNPRKFSFVFASFMFISAFTFMLGEEWSREMMRKPYVIYNFLYSNGLHKDKIEDVNQKGFFNVSNWAKAELMAHGGEDADQLTKGRLVFRYQCMSCHNPTGYRSMENLLGERDETAINSLIDVMREAHKEDNPYKGIMPPFVGHDDEQKALATYLATQTKAYKEQANEAMASKQNTDSAAM